jgi:phosphatidylinositol kinase/protein kinase (PI-3  family)
MASLSMASYIVGLGDRHAENFLIDTSNGQVVQIDVSLLFERGKFLPIAERVPFRLTRSIIYAFGLTGYEGVYRRVSEIAMQVLRENKDAILNVLETFVFDPLVEWSKAVKQQQQQQGQSRDKSKELATQLKATNVIRVIARKLDGCVVEFEDYRQLPEALEAAYERASPVGVQAQVSQLIAQATNEDNLKHMFGWWFPWV